MRTPILVIIFLALGACSQAQDCKQYFFLQNNKTVEMTMYSKKGDPAGKTVYVISDVQNAGGITTGTINTEIFDKKGKSIAKGVNNVKCTGGVMQMDMKMMIPAGSMEQFRNTEMKGESNYLEYPSNMKEGDQLKDASFTMTGQNGPMTYKMDMNITDRKVQGKESITTTAGTWDCFKITSKSKMNMKMGINIPMNFETTEWYAPGFGVVKTESNKGGGTEITAVR
ncbi:MAG TPA: hypothetical protein VJT83_01535 [Chitinophagaceae bacterium]|nr:hypothetical protein [Chitinophagaceae bacterium]